MSGATVVIGADADALVAAHYLARAGRRALVVDEREAPDAPALEPGWIPPRVVRDLALERHGLVVHAPDPWAAAPLPDGGRLELARDLARSAASTARASRRAAHRRPQFCGRMARLARVLELLYAGPPPDPLARAPGELARMAGLAWRVRRLGRRAIEDLLRVLPMPAADLLDDWFESDELKGLLGLGGVMHLAQGPRSGGTAFALLHGHVGSPPGVFRPPRSNLVEVLARLPGIEVRRGARVARITVRARRAAGIVLATGEEIAADCVVSGIDPRRTLLELVDPAWLDPELVRAVRNVRARGVVARATLLLDREPGFSALTLAPSLDDLERAHDDAKYGRVPQRPALEAHAVDEAADAAGRRRVDVHVQYAPHALAEGAWDSARRAALGDQVVALLAAHLPGGAAAVVERSVRTPLDLEAARGWPQGQMHHAELALDQALWMRPVPALAQYRTPIRALYLGGPATHPGGGIAGAAGANAAREIIRDARRGRL
ncbi:MAG: NAD(P)/FAD-dependent oxidoreductase [Burkholderiales bacterium]|nr:NAD(P)/FAD-dependent oxidoreductase [Burkholderiales bacterium]